MKRLLILTVVVIGVALACLHGGDYLKSKIDPIQANKPNLAVATLLPTAKSLGEFNLKDMNGNPFNHKSLQGHWSLVFFGYADCPDVCPATLAQVAQLWSSYEDKKPHPNAQFIFVSLNPVEDKPEQLKGFLTRFNPNFIGVTGTETEIERVSKLASAYSWKDPNKSKAGKTVIDHSATLLLFNPEGRLHAMFTPPHQINEIKKDLAVLLNR